MKLIDVSSKFTEFQTLSFVRTLGLFLRKGIEFSFFFLIVCALREDSHADNPKQLKERTTTEHLQWVPACITEVTVGGT